jgi:riboflavin kinase/FMN adenylyltransferase
MDSVWACTIGNFDGVHKGHIHLIEKCLAWKRMQQLANPAVPFKTKVITFEPHPLEVLRPEIKVKRICSPEEKRERLLNLGADEVDILKFDSNMSQMDANVFLNFAIGERFRCGFLTVGENFKFGKNRGGDVKTLEKWCALSTPDRDITFHVAQIQNSDGEKVSSSKIRSLIESGQMVACSRLLGRNFSVTGRVVHGDKRGRLLGFPTANLVPNTHQNYAICTPLNGVYFTHTTVGESIFPSITNVGVKPTVGSANTPLTIETHILDFTGDLYEKVITVEFLDRLRDEKRFGSLDELKQQIQIDTSSARQKLRFV